MYGYFGVFDGHGSDHSSAHLSNNLHKFIIENEQFHAGEYEKAIYEGLKKEDEALKSLKQTRSGSTATVALIAGGHIHLGNVGDSRSVLGIVEDGKLVAKRLSRDHKPDDPEEKKRIEAAGGFVADGRVYGEDSAINMSRAMGDFPFKTPQNNAPADWISNNAHLAAPIPVTTDTKFIIIASDGLWDVTNDSKAVEVVDRLHRQGFSAEEITKQIASTVGATRFADNTTVIIVFFDFSDTPILPQEEAKLSKVIISQHSV